MKIRNWNCHLNVELTISSFRYPKLNSSLPFHLQRNNTQRKTPAPNIIKCKLCLSASRLKHMPYHNFSHPCLVFQKKRQILIMSRYTPNWSFSSCSYHLTLWSLKLYPILLLPASYNVYSLKISNGGSGSAEQMAQKSTGHSLRAARCDSQQSYCGWQPAITPVSGDLIGLWGHQAIT